MKTAYILTNGYMDETAQDFNYVRLFRTLIEAENFAKVTNIPLKYDLYEIEIPENNEATANIMVVITVNHQKHVKYVENYEEFSKIAFKYYERQHNKCISSDTDDNLNYCINTITKIKNNIIFCNKLLIVQMFGQRKLSQNNYIYVGKIPFYSV